MKHSKIKATAHAARLAAECGPGWEPRVWNNLGWHYAADHSATGFGIHQHLDRYFATGRSLYVGDCRGRSAAAVIEKIRQRCTAVRDDAQTQLDAL